jgi:enamine deaminase RidA (YjgF/YER057c/UK114 family)
MGRFKASGIELPEGEYGIPPADPARPDQVRMGKGRWVVGSTADGVDPSVKPMGFGRATKAGGMVYISSMGPVDPETGTVVNSDIKLQTRQAMQNLKSRLEEVGSSLDKVVWANWSLRDPTEFDIFNEEWIRWFPGDAPGGQCTLLPSQQRRAGFRVSLGVIAEA